MRVQRKAQILLREVELWMQAGEVVFVQGREKAGGGRHHYSLLLLKGSL